MTDLQNLERWKAEAKKAGLTLLGPAKNRRSTYRHYEVRKCGHTRDLPTGSVRAKSEEIPKTTYRCKECAERQYKKEAKLVGLTIIGAAKNGNSLYRNYQFDRCSHTQDITRSAVKKGGFICRGCEETAWDLPSNVYLLRITLNSFEWLKVGHARNVEERIKRYGISSKAKVKKVQVVEIDTGREAAMAEGSIHRKYKGKGLSPRKMRKFHTVSGSGECYPIGLLKKFSKELHTLSQNIDAKS